MHTKKLLAWFSASVLAMSLMLPSGSRAQKGQSPTATQLSGLKDKVTVLRDENGIPHIQAKNDRDVYFAMGYVHAQDRLFQMDFNRRHASGTLAELLGAGEREAYLMSDIQYRRNGLLRAARASLEVYSPENRAILESYADGVNAWLDQHPLPAEYEVLELTKANVPRWTAVDSLVCAKDIAFQLSYDVIDLNHTRILAAYQKAGEEKGFDGTKLFFEDIFCAAPFDSTTTIPRASASGQVSAAKGLGKIQSGSKGSTYRPDRRQIAAIDGYLNDIRDIDALNRGRVEIGSNWWAIAGTKTTTGQPMMANDPHLFLRNPAVFYEIHLMVSPQGKQPPMNVYGVSFPGIPGVILGFNERISWGATTTQFDVTDFYSEQIVLDEKTKKPIATRYQGKEEPLVTIPETFRVNKIGDKTVDNVVTVPSGNRLGGIPVPESTLVVPRRNNGPIISTTPGATPNQLTGISLQFIGNGPTHDVQAFLSWARAQNMEDFKRGLQWLDSTTQNWCYIDVDGHIAYFSSGELPLREDLQAGKVDGVPPTFVRDGTGQHKNEWIRKDNPPPDQALHFEILPFDEMPQLVDPPQGFIANANNDPTGTNLDNDQFNEKRRGGQGILYLSRVFDAGFRIGKITQLIQKELDTSKGGRGKISLEDMKRIQSNTQMSDMEVLLPHLFKAFEAGRKTGAPPELAALANDVAVVEAIGRLRNWDFTTPTGIQEGFDESDEVGVRKPPTDQEIRNSVAATIASMWRNLLIRSAIDATLQRAGLGNFLSGSTSPVIPIRRLLESFDATKGRGKSGLTFFDVPELSAPPEVKRDVILLKSLKDGLNRLASQAFASAFNQSTKQDDYRWGKLHSILFTHLLGSLAVEYSIPPAAGFADPTKKLATISTDGGFGTIDSATHGVRANVPEAFEFEGGAARRFVCQVQPNKQFKAYEVIPGGESGVFGNKFYGSMFNMWLTNKYHDAYFYSAEVGRIKGETESLIPAK
jgi:penicillin G amidase